MGSDKACLTRAELEFTQRIQLQIEGLIPTEVLAKWNGCTADILQAALSETFSRFPEPQPEPLLKFLGIVTIPATERFIVSDRIAAIRKSGRKIYTGSNFEKWFFEITVEPIEETQLRHYKLLKAEVDGTIIAELGGKIKAETTFSGMLALMEKQANGENGILLTNGYANIFYIRDGNGVLRAVGCYWDGGGWYVRADSVEGPDRWGEGYQVFSCNSLKS